MYADEKKNKKTICTDKFDPMRDKNDLKGRWDKDGTKLHTQNP